jgi:hypothetical protein
MDIIPPSLSFKVSYKLYLNALFRVLQFSTFNNIFGAPLFQLNINVCSDELDMGMTPASVQELEETRPKLRIDKLLRECAVSITDYDNSRTSRASQQTVNESTIGM